MDSKHGLFFDPMFDFDYALFYPPGFDIKQWRLEQAAKKAEEQRLRARERALALARHRGVGERAVQLQLNQNDPRNGGHLEDNVVTRQQNLRTNNPVGGERAPVRGRGRCQGVSRTPHRDGRAQSSARQRGMNWPREPSVNVNERSQQPANVVTRLQNLRTNNPVGGERAPVRGRGRCQGTPHRAGRAQSSARQRGMNRPSEPAVNVNERSQQPANPSSIGFQGLRENEYQGSEGSRCSRAGRAQMSTRQTGMIIGHESALSVSERSQQPVNPSCIGFHGPRENEHQGSEGENGQK